MIVHANLDLSENTPSKSLTLEQHLYSSWYEIKIPNLEQSYQINFPNITMFQSKFLSFSISLSWNKILTDADHVGSEDYLLPNINKAHL